LKTTSDSGTTNESYANFWTDFKAAYDSHFPKVSLKPNKNKQKNNFLTPELPAFRRTKLELHKLCVINPTPDNIAKYKKHRNEYNAAIRKQKA